MPRPPRFVETTLARFPAGTFARIWAVLRPGEDRATFFRDAVNDALERRESDAGNDESAGGPREGDRRR